MHKYGFTDINQNPTTSAGLQTIFGGVNLDQTISGFVTMTVTGREVMEQELKITQRVGGNGAWIDDVRIPSRTITVKAHIEDYASVADELNELLHGSVNTLTFTDDDYWHFDAYFRSVNAPENNRKNQIVELVFLCPNPFAKSDVYQTSSMINSEFRWEVSLEKMTVKFASDATVGKINLGAYVILIDDVKTTETFVIDWNGVNILTSNGAPMAHRLQLASDFHNIKLKNGATISSVPLASITLEYREQKL